MLTREVKKWASMSSFGQWMCSMNGDCFEVLTQRNLLLFCLKMKVRWTTLRTSCHLLFCTLHKKNGSLHPPIKYNSLSFLESFNNWVFFFIMCFSSFYFVYASISYVFFFCIRFKVYVKVSIRVYFKVLNLRFMFRF